MFSTEPTLIDVEEERKFLRDEANAEIERLKAAIDKGLALFARPRFTIPRPDEPKCLVCGGSLGLVLYGGCTCMVYR